MIPRRAAEIQLTTIVMTAGVDTVDDAVDGLVKRFLRVTLADKDRAVLAEFLHGRLGTSGLRASERLEESLRELLYLVLSTPEYQLG